MTIPKTKIEWCDYTANPVKGKCPLGCSYCYARRLYDRFHWNPALRYDPKAMLDTVLLPGGSKVFVGSTMELFSSHIKPEWLYHIFHVIRRCPWVTYILLSKCQLGLPAWNPYPANCWVGVTITSNDHKDSYIGGLAVTQAQVKFISFEPLLDWTDSPGQTELLSNTFQLCGIKWVIIGQQTPVSKKTQPRIEWVAQIIQAADLVGIPVFLKDNLKPLLIAQGSQDSRYWRDLRDTQGFEPLHCELRQELPGK